MQNSQVSQELAKPDNYTLQVKDRLKTGLTENVFKKRLKSHHRQILGFILSKVEKRVTLDISAGAPGTMLKIGR